MEILYRDEHFIAVNKPSGFHVHPHEDPQHRVSRDLICLYIVRKLAGQYVFPVHRLDAGTSGVLLFALSSVAAREMSKLFIERQTHKLYHAVVRGYVQPEGHINIPLELDSTGEKVEAHTSYRRLATVELPVAVGKKFPTARYSLVEIRPHTGRYHQIRRHFNRLSHPLLGDAVHGDSHHNRFFRNSLQISGLCLHASGLSFKHPFTQNSLQIAAPPTEKWNKIHALFHYTPSDAGPLELVDPEGK